MRLADFQPGKEAYGRIPKLEGEPVFYVNGKYYLCRAKTARGILWDAWYKAGLREMAVQLEGGVSLEKALRACQEHADGVSAV